MRVTVFTPTYNRAYIIENLYNSLKRQSFRDFEWIVVDDGSTDNTESLFNEILAEENDFHIRYIKTANGGKHRAINRGVSEAEGEMFFIVDSDDYLTDDALLIIDNIESEIKTHDREEFCGICGLKGFSATQAVGTSFSGEYLDITVLEREKYKIRGDKAEVFYTHILKKYPFPTFDGENFLTECVVWDKIASDGYKMRFFNQIIYVCDYLPDGLTAHSSKLFVDNPKGYGLYLAQSSEYGKIKGIEKWNGFLDYFYQTRKTISFFEISRNLKINPIILWLRLLVMRVFYRLYNK